MGRQAETGTVCPPVGKRIQPRQGQLTCSCVSGVPLSGCGGSNRDGRLEILRTFLLGYYEPSRAMSTGARHASGERLRIAPAA